MTKIAKEETTEAPFEYWKMGRKKEVKESKYLNFGKFYHRPVRDIGDEEFDRLRDIELVSVPSELDE